MIITRTFAATVAFSLAALSAQAVTLDFNTDNNGVTTPGNLTSSGQFSDFGVTITTTNPNGNPLALYNSNCGPDFPGTPCTGSDEDLASGPTYGTEPQGRVLIINEGTNSDPDDDADGGVFEFAFTRASDLIYVDILDLDEPTAPIFTGFVGMASSVLTPDSIVLLGSETMDNSLRRFFFSEEGLDALYVDLPDISGAIAGLNYAPVPVPAALPLTLGGLAVLAGLKRARRKS